MPSFGKENNSSAEKARDEVELRSEPNSEGRDTKASTYGTRRSNLASPDPAGSPFRKRSTALRRSQFASTSAVELSTQRRKRTSNVTFTGGVQGSRQRTVAAWPSSSTLSRARSATRTPKESPHFPRAATAGVRRPGESKIRSQRQLGKSVGRDMVERSDESEEEDLSGEVRFSAKPAETDEMQRELRAAMVKRALTYGGKKRNGASTPGAGARKNDEFFKVLMASKRNMKKRYDL